MTVKQSAEIQQSIELAQQIVRTQGNLFIKELLREKRKSDPKVKIGVAKDDILENLISAIEERRISLDDLHKWIGEVEGWGRQHVYLFRLSQTASSDPSWDSQVQLERRFRRAFGTGFGTKDSSSVDFPDNMALSAASFADGILEIIWRERSEQWHREPARDERRKIRGDLYQFRAHRQELSRTVTRFVLTPKAMRAALFVQFPLKDPKHEGACAAVRASVDPLVSWSELSAIEISNVIKSFDESELAATGDRDPGRIVAQNTKFSASGASILFEADPGNSQWKNVSAVRGVRRALKATEFSGHSAVFQLQLRTSDGLDRNVTMSLSGKDKRVYLPAQMTDVEVWQVLEKVVEHST